MAYLASWMQWLRHTRHEAPTINEQQLDEIRQAKMKLLAAQADARWASKPSYLDYPSNSVDFAPIHTLSEADMKDAEIGPALHAQLAEKPITEVESKNGIQVKRARKEVRWEELTLGKSNDGPQPQPWAPRSVKRR